MSLDEFLEKFLENLIDTKKGIDDIKAAVKSNMETKDYYSAKVLSQVFTKEENFEPRVEISSEGYDDREIVFIDYYLD